MKTKFILYFLGLFICIFSQAQNFDALQKHSETKILYDRVFPVSKAKELKTNDVTANYFLQVYHEIQRADFLNRFPKLESVKKIVDEGFIKNYIPLSLLITDFENIKPSELESKMFLSIIRRITMLLVLRKMFLMLIRSIYWERF